MCPLFDSRLWAKRDTPKLCPVKYFTITYNPYSFSVKNQMTKEG